MPRFFWRWCVAWLDGKGLTAVASVLERRAARLGDVEAMHAVAKRALKGGDHVAALAAIAPALAREPGNPALWCTRGVANRLALAFDEARTDYEQAIKLSPKFVQALSNLGELHLARGSAQDALHWLNAALALDPDYFEARVNHLAALIEIGRLEEARREGENLIASEPGRPEPYGSLGNVLVQTGKAREAVKLYKKALELRPDYPQAHFNLAILLGSPEDQKKAIGYLEAQITQRGESNSTMSLLAAAHLAAGHLGKAQALCRRVIERQADNLSAHITLASCISAGGDASAAVPIFERVLELDDSQVAMASTVIFELNYLPGFSREEIFRRHQAWAQRYEAPLLSRAVCNEREHDPLRQLRIGYVSGDFCGHPVGFLLRDILRHHDRKNFQIHCFSVVLRPDEVSADIRAASDVWHDVLLESAEELAAAIRSAEIDVLVDLSGHTALHRLLTFAYRPAPIQATWIGYFHSTGMSAMDYFITDPHTSPPQSGQLFSEVAVYLPQTRFCYVAPQYAPDVAPPPVRESGSITFGSFNRLAKLNDQVLATWAQILLSVPASRLVLKAAALAEDEVRKRFVDRFAKHGVNCARLDLRAASAHREMFAEYGEIDIALDPFPFNGGMTTLEALWMGVPVLTLEGDSVVSRQTYSALANIGLADELAFASVEAYVQGAVALANQPARLAELRSQIRPRMAASPLCQSEQFSRDLGTLYRRMWQAWCRGEKLIG